MTRRSHAVWSLLGCGLSSLLLAGCFGSMPRPLADLNRLLLQAGTSRSPTLSDRWLALIVQRGGRDQVVLVDLNLKRPVPLPGLNRPDAQPLTVAVDGTGQQVAVVRQREGQTELVLYRRSVQSTEVIPMRPSGVPRQVSLRADGRELAVEISRDGVWQIDLLSLP